MRSAHRFPPVLMALWLVACDGNAGQPPPGYTGEYRSSGVGGSAARGRSLIEQHGCGSCHTVPGVRRARGRVAPPLNFFAERSFIGGELPNRPEVLVQWIMDAPALIPATAMPATHIDESDARDIAAYLYTLH